MSELVLAQPPPGKAGGEVAVPGGAHTPARRHAPGLHLPEDGQQDVAEVAADQLTGGRNIVRCLET